ncbi:Intraflagellar transport protein 172 [Spironucleus salmonicida]|uniref:Intraflagellar transport protein 172 n=1 Tax=Spironucleus salmonicida TaxID=348837 RepID=V6LNU0_9EUKA|nr:Intraflagellar transport protein 172 [Spironucleus salmonicida]|eukprot:EST45908.1 Intraflagellar transport protein 172 [Spironucleus salmonicida]
MQLKFNQTLQPTSTFAASISSMDWSPDGKKLAAASLDRQIHFYNENGDRVEKIGMRSFDLQKPNQNFIPTSISFSSDGTALAAGQSDCVVYVFSVGKNFEKKSISSRFPVHASVTAVCWMRSEDNPLQSDIIAGCCDGSVYKLNVAKKQIQPLCSFQNFTQLLQTKQVPCDLQVGQPGTPVHSILRVSDSSVVICNENGISALYESENQLLKVASRHQSNITATAVFRPRNVDKPFLLICDTTGKIIVNAVETGQALAQVQVKTPYHTIFTSAVGNPAGNGALIACSYGVYYISLQSVNPISLIGDLSSSLEIALADGPQTTISALVWKPDSSQINVSNSSGGIDMLSPSLSSSTYCGVDVTNTAPNKAQLLLKNFNSKNLNLQAGVLELFASQSTEMKSIKSYPKTLFVDAVKTGNWSQSMYLVGYGDRSICIYSFEMDMISEIQIQLGHADKLYFDVGVKRVLVVANMQLGEFTVIYLPQLANQQPIMFTTIRQCSFAAKTVISCSPQFDTSRKFVLVSHLGEDRQEFVITELTPPDQADDFSEPISIIARIKHTRIIDWIDMSPTGKFVMVRDVSGAILIYSIETQKMIDLSPTLGNGIIVWACPFDVIVAQEQADAPILVYYNPGDSDDKPDLLQVPTDNGGWNLQYLDSSQVALSGARQAANIFAIVSRADGERKLQLQLDGDLLLFNMLLQKQEVNGACILLSKSNSTNKNQWMRLCQLALQQHQFMVVSRCYAALGDLGLSKYSRQVFNEIKQNSKQFESEYVQQTYCEAQVCLIKGDLDGYEKFIVQCGKNEEALKMYRELKLYHRAEHICNENEKEQLYQESIDWLISTSQSTLAAQLKAQKGDFRGALELLMNDRAYLAAFELCVRILQQDPDGLSQHAVEALASNLEQAGHFIQSAYLCKMSPIKDSMRALALFRRGAAYQEAISLARQTLPNECIYIEKEWADQLVTTGHYDQAVQHYIEARETRRAVDAALKANDYDTAERLLQNSQIENSIELCLRLAEAKFLSGDIDGAVKWFASADTPLLAVAAFTSVGRYQEGVNFAVQNFPGSNVADVLLQEARRLIQIEQKRTYNTQNNSTISAASVLQRMENMSAVHGVLAARDLLQAAGMHEHVIELLQSNQLYDELVVYAKEQKVKSLPDVLQFAAQAKRAKNDMRGCANLLGDLCVELYMESQQNINRSQSAQANSLLKRTLSEATLIFNNLNMYEESIQLAKKCNDGDTLVNVAIQWISNQPSQMQNVISLISKLGKLEQTIIKATEQRMFAIAMQLAENTANPETAKIDIWYRQGMILEQDMKLQEAEHAYTMAQRSAEALHMYIDHKRFFDAERVANNMPSGQQKEQAIRMIKEGRARALLDEGKYKDAEQLYLELDQIDDIVAQYSKRQMWQEALKIAKQNGRQDLVVKISEEFADQDNKKIKESAVIPGSQTGPNMSDIQTRKKEQKPQNTGPVPTTLRGQIIQAAKSGGEIFLEFLLKRAHQLSDLALQKSVQDQNIADDVAIIGSLIPHFNSIPSNEERAVYLAATYLSQGVPQTLMNENDKSKSTISPLFNSQMNSAYLLTLAKAVLSLEFTEDDYISRVNKLEVQRDGIFQKVRNILLMYRQALMANQKGQQLASQNKILIIPGDAELSRCTDAIHLVVQCAQSLSNPNTPQQLREKCQITSSLVRYCDIIPVDRCLALAGLTCKKFYQLLQNETSPQAVAFRRAFGGQAFVFLNRLLDVIEHQQTGAKTTGDLDASDIRQTGIPWDVSVPRLAYIGESSLEDARGFVMNMSVQQADAEQDLPIESCPHGCGSDRWTGATSCTKCRNTSPICCITGQHVINAHLKTIPAQPACNVCHSYARPAPWNNYIQKTKSCPVCGEMANPMSK